MSQGAGGCELNTPTAVVAYRQLELGRAHLGRDVETPLSGQMRNHVDLAIAALDGLLLISRLAILWRRSFALEGGPERQKERHGGGGGKKGASDWKGDKESMRSGDLKLYSMSGGCCRVVLRTICCLGVGKIEIVTLEGVTFDMDSLTQFAARSTLDSTRPSEASAIQLHRHPPPTTLAGRVHSSASAR